jgi:hypothetical protein
MVGIEWVCDRWMIQMIPNIDARFSGRCASTMFQGESHY